MNKSKRLGIIIGTAILSIILVVAFSTVAVRSTTVKRTVELGNKYISEGNYKEAIIAFEKAINIDSKNTDVKETLDILYIYKEIDQLVIAGDLTSAQEKLEEIKDMPKFDIIKDMVENIKENIEEELFTNGMGNSIENIISGGNVAYKGDYVFYSNPKDEGKLYKMNIETGESLKIADEFATNINVYNDYVYYTDYDDYHNTPDNKAVKRIKFDGSEEEILLTESDDSFYNNMQIIDNYLYYDCNFDPLEDFSFYYSADIYKMDLDTLETSEVITGINPTWIINKTSSGELDLYITQRYGIYGYRDINGVNEQIDIHGELWNAEVVGINSENIYYNTLHLNDAFTYYNGYETSGMGVTKLQTESSEVFKGSELAINNYKILADDCFYVNNNGTLYSIDLSNGNESMIKKLYNSIEEYRDESLFEVKGYLAYFNENNELTIDKDIIVKKMNNKEDVVEESIGEDKELLLREQELMDIIAYVKDEVGKYTGNQVVFYEFDSENNIYSFINQYIDSALGYDYNANTGEIICSNQGLFYVINDNFRNVTDTTYFTKEESDEYVALLRDVYSREENKVYEPSLEIQKLLESKISDCIDYLISEDELVSIDGI